MAETSTAYFEERVGNRGRVRFADSTVATLRNVSAYHPRNGDAVRVVRDGADSVITGPIAPKEPVGQVTSVSGDRCQVLTVDGTIHDDLRTLTPVELGDEVLIDWPSGGHVLGRFTAGG